MKTLAPLLLALAGALATAPAPAAASGPDGPVFGVSYGSSPYMGRLARIDPLTLRPRGPRAPVRGAMWSFARSPRGRSVAIGASTRGRVVVARLGSMRARTLEPPVGGPWQWLAWPSARRIVGVTGFGQASAHVLDPRDGRLLSTRSLGGFALAAEPAFRALVVLAGGTDGPAPARLAIVRGDGTSFVDLPLRAGLRTHPDVRLDDPPDVVPGLAVDQDRGVAYVVDAEEPRIVRVDLRSRTVTEHGLGVARSSKGGASNTRTARVLPGGLLAAAGWDQPASARGRAWGIRVIDPRTWEMRVIRPGAPSFQIAGRLLIDTRYRNRGGRPTVFAYTPRGRLRWRFTPRYGISDVVTTDSHVYVKNGARRGHNHRTHVLDARTGRRVRVLPFTTLPRLLIRR